MATTTTTVVISPPNQPATVVRMGSGAQPRVALTFDAGSDGGSTSRILDLLAARGLHATFGLTGQWVLRYPELARRIVAEGHAILNHTQDHRSFTGYSTSSAALTTSARLAELADAAANIKAVTGADPSPWFRPPYGDYDNGVLADVGAAGYRSVVMWSTDSLGWRGIDPAQVVARTLGGAQPGAILLFHVGSASTDADALPAILDGLQARGLAPVTIPELLGVPSGPGH